MKTPQPQSRRSVQRMVLPTAFERMEQLRGEGWCVVLKCLPKEIGWMIEGSRSEYDAPCPDKFMGKGKWCCEVSWMGKGRYRPMRDALADTPDEAVQKVFSEVSRLTTKLSDPAHGTLGKPET